MNTQHPVAHLQIKALSRADQLVHNDRQMRVEVLGLAVVGRGGDVQDDDVARVIAHRLWKVHVDENKRPEADCLFVLERAHPIPTQNSKQTEMPFREVLWVGSSYLYNAVAMGVNRTVHITPHPKAHGPWWVRY